MDLSQRRSNNPADPEPIEYRYFPEAQQNAYTATARELPEVKTVLWFTRFPVVRFWKEGEQAVVEIVDLRFVRGGRRPAAFTYRVRFAADGRILSKGWLRD